MSNTHDNLLEQARKLNPQALGEIYDLYSEEIYKYVYKHIGHPQLTEDLVSDVFKRFLISLSRGGGPTQHLRAYLYRIAHNLITDFYRKQPPPSLELQEDKLLQEDQDPSGFVSNLQEADQVRHALKLITPEQRQVIILRYLEGWESGEIAQTMGKSLGAVKALQHRGLAALQRILLGDQDQDEEEHPKE